MFASRYRIPRVSSQKASQTTNQAAEQATKGNENNSAITRVADSVTTPGNDDAQPESEQTTVAEAREKTGATMRGMKHGEAI